MDSQPATATTPPWSVCATTGITLKTFLGFLTEMGLVGKTRNTGSPDYRRVFIEERGIQIGRACIYQGMFSHVKWYGDGRPNKYDYLLSARLEHGRFPTTEEYDEAFSRSKKQAQDQYEAKLQWRREHPLPVRLPTPENPEPKQRHRKRISPPNYYSHLGRHLRDVMQESS